MNARGGVTAPRGFRAAGNVLWYPQGEERYCDDHLRRASHLCGRLHAEQDPGCLRPGGQNSAQTVANVFRYRGEQRQCERMHRRTGPQRYMGDGKDYSTCIESSRGTSHGSSTGVIGQYMPMDKVIPAIGDLAGRLSTSGNEDAAEAIMTTDTFPKEAGVHFSLGKKVITIGGVAKGSGMIAPNMATMLAFVTSDIVISHDLLAKALRSANNRSFNRISVDGDMSTNDMVLVMANGRAENPHFLENSEEYQLFVVALEYVLIKLAKMIAKDGEGATKLIEIMAKGAWSEEEAAQAGKAVANSNLVKTAIHGADANWGRILAAVGYSGIDFNPDNVEISFGDLPILKSNYEIVLNEEKAKEILLKDNVVIVIDLKQGSHFARFWTCDLTKEYVHINASYRS